MSDQKDDDNYEYIITLVNDKDTLRSFVEQSPGGIQFAFIVLFDMAQSYYNSSANRGKRGEGSNPPPFSFSSREFMDKYSQLAYDMRIIKYIARHLAFQEFVLTLEYLSFVREEEPSSKYELKISLEDLKWLASVALQQIAGGQNLSSPQIFYPIPPRTLQPDRTINPPTMGNIDNTRELIKELSQNIISRQEVQTNPDNGTSISYDDLVLPRSRDYGLHRPDFAHRVAPTIYSFRKPNDEEWKRIVAEFLEGQRCITCNELVLPDYFNIWIGEPLSDDENNNATANAKQDQRFSEVLANFDSVNMQSNQDEESVGITQRQTIGNNATDRELLVQGYGIIPMDGRDAFIAFAKPKMTCPTCGTDPANSVSLMPKY
jgi:hypothetical protein